MVVRGGTPAAGPGGILDSGSQTAKVSSPTGSSAWAVLLPARVSGGGPCGTQLCRGQQAHLVGECSRLRSDLYRARPKVSRAPDLAAWRRPLLPVPVPKQGWSWGWEVGGGGGGEVGRGVVKVFQSGGRGRDRGGRGASGGEGARRGRRRPSIALPLALLLLFFVRFGARQTVSRPLLFFPKRCRARVWVRRLRRTDGCVTVCPRVSRPCFYMVTSPEAERMGDERREEGEDEGPNVTCDPLPVDGRPGWARAAPERRDPIGGPRPACLAGCGERDGGKGEREDGRGLVVGRRTVDGTAAVVVVTVVVELGV